MQGNVFENLWHQPKNWWLLAAALATCTAAALLTFVRWWYLSGAGHPLPVHRRNPHQFLGLSVNFAPLGIVSGDFVKAVILDHEHPKNRARPSLRSWSIG